MSCLRTKHSDAGEALSRGPSVLSPALNHLATVLPLIISDGLIHSLLTVPYFQADSTVPEELELVLAIHHILKQRNNKTDNTV